MAGASAQAAYERRREHREERARARWGRFHRIGRIAARLSDAPQHEKAWRQGAEGERHNATRLERLLKGRPVAFLHDRRIPNSEANIDHIAIAPSGVMVIDSKNLTGRVKVDWKGGLFSPRRWDLYVCGRRKTKYVENLERQVGLVSAALSEAGLADVPVHGALCMANGEGLPLLRHFKLREVIIDRPRYVAKLLSKRAETLSTERIELVRSVLDQRFRPY